MYTKVILHLLVFLSPILIYSCSETDESSKNTKNEENQTEVITDVNVRLFVRKDVGYDSEGYPVDMGVVKEITDFNESKKYTKENKYDQVEKITIEGTSDDIFIDVYDNEKDTIIYSKQNLNLKDEFSFTYKELVLNPDENHVDWLNWRWYPNIVLSISHKNSIIFKGKILQ